MEGKEGRGRWGEREGEIASVSADATAKMKVREGERKERIRGEELPECVSEYVCV